MEIIRKEISIDKCRSHKNGLLPFIQCGNGNHISGKTNYGNFVCDLGKKNNIRIGTIKTTYNELMSTSGKVGEVRIVTDEVSGISGTIGNIPKNTVFMWNGDKWVHYNKIIKYTDLIKRYNFNKKILNNGILCKCIETSKGKKILKKINNDLIELGCSNIKNDNNVFNYQPINSKNFISLKNDTYEYTSTNEPIKVNKKYVIINDFEKYEGNEIWANDNDLSLKRSGYYSTLIQCVDEEIIKTAKILKKFLPLVPTVEFSILFENEHAFDTIYYPYEYSVIGNTQDTVIINNEAYTAKVGTDIVNIYDSIENDNQSKMVSGLSYLVESKLDNFNHPQAFKITDDHFGIMEGWVDENNKSISKLFKCIYYQIDNPSTTTQILQNKNTYQVINLTTDEDIFKSRKWWECVEISDSEKNNYINGDNEDINPGDKKYRNITMLSCIPWYVQNPKNGDIYYFYAAFQNGEIKPTDTIDSYSEIKKLTFPFKINVPVNIESINSATTIYDIVTNVDYVTIGKDIYCNINYIKGATSGKTDTGIFYTEQLKYESGVTKNAWIEGTNQADLYYEKLDYYTNSKTYFNPEYNTNFENIRLATITQMELGGFSNNFIKVPLFTKEGTENLYSEPKVTTDVIFNRGSAAGWEKHFKLSECNTFQDLKNYGNNIFNL